MQQKNLRRERLARFVVKLKNACISLMRSINPLTAATTSGVKRFRVLNTTVNIKDIL
jgi:hypothetical protein